MHVTQEKGIIRGREGEDRPGEMNYRGLLTPWRWKVGGGWLKFIKAAAMRSPRFHPPTNVFWFYSNFWEEIKKKQLRPFFSCHFHSICFVKELNQGNISPPTKNRFHFYFFFWERNLLHRNLAHFLTQIFKEKLLFFFNLLLFQPITATIQQLP